MNYARAISAFAESSFMPRPIHRPLAVLGLLLAALPAPASDNTGSGGKNVYQHTLKSTVWIVNMEELGGGKVAIRSGSGSLLSVPDRLVLTNYHVVRDAPTVKVMFPIFDKKELVAEKDQYIKLVLSGAGGIVGKVVAKEPRADLALVQLQTLPAGVAALRLAKDGVGPGDDVHSIGNPGASGALWAYTRGSVKAVYRKRFMTSGRGNEGAFEVDAKIVETSSPVNAGDSGGPVVNGNAELVAVTQGHLADESARSISIFIDLSEVRALLKKAGYNRVLTQQPSTAVARGEAKSGEAKDTVKETSAKETAAEAEKEEKLAASKLVLARQFLTDRPAKARERLEEIVKQYPNTRAAREAKELLEKLRK